MKLLFLYLKHIVYYEKVKFLNFIPASNQL
jgi:hypothetical protein